MLESATAAPAAEQGLYSSAATAALGGEQRGDQEGKEKEKDRKDSRSQRGLLGHLSLMSGPPPPPGARGQAWWDTPDFPPLDGTRPDFNLHLVEILHQRNLLIKLN